PDFQGWKDMPFLFSGGMDTAMRKTFFKTPNTGPTVYTLFAPEGAHEFAMVARGNQIELLADGRSKGKTSDRDMPAGYVFIAFEGSGARVVLKDLKAVNLDNPTTLRTGGNSVLGVALQP
ncbi:MAG: hypothetical protein V1809_08040, partial [Planctomycetota bacterium]